MTEKELQRAVLRLARLLGWFGVHFRPARTARGWRTPVEGDGVGFVDVILVKNRVLWRELKGDGGRLRPEQAAWIARLQAAGCDAGVWTSQHWRDGIIEKELRG